MKAFLLRWKYRLIVWFVNKPEGFQRRKEIEESLWLHANRGTSPTPAECKMMAMKLGVPRRFWRG